MPRLNKWLIAVAIVVIYVLSLIAVYGAGKNYAAKQDQERASVGYDSQPPDAVGPVLLPIKENCYPHRGYGLNYRIICTAEAIGTCQDNKSKGGG